ncbi:hypothetical protein DICPUDRAFT_83862 [Dictyostelium purpureum]|uniref:SUEL-type lectin domain-containing protein n=1 Tax=Dictyostelium purpureum TaxID=5786 RepID=F1A0V2_DICPU|nr:uncharacterized protein DICPUDRAFT_83862 [Dictyostelium purpureum]EGC30170.1 hypothetical protein DICPUDRAFT_83862 [Dictyostelium purpureum]|eukprot:XP_003293296.1 hypothetical protein DICPUDRAFT_83862 [Dictyostelium purpureum]
MKLVFFLILIIITVLNGFEIKVFKYNNLLCEGESDEINSVPQCSIMGYFQLAGNRNLLARIAVSNYTECSSSRKIDNFIKINECIPNEFGFSQFYTYSENNEPSLVDDFCNEYIFFNSDGNSNSNNNNNSSSSSNRNNNSFGDCDKVKIHSFRNGTCKYLPKENEYIKRFCYGGSKTIHEYACDSCIGINCSLLNVINNVNNCSEIPSKKISTPELTSSSPSFKHRDVYSYVFLFMVILSVLII